MPSLDSLGGLRHSVRLYGLLALSSLLFITLLLAEKQLGIWAFLPGAVGGIGLIASWGAMPPFVLFLLMVLLFGQHFFIGIPFSIPLQTVPLLDFLLAVAVLVYIACSSRVLTLTKHGVPPDTRHSLRSRATRLFGRWFLPTSEAGRSATELPAMEVAGMGFTAFLSVFVASLLWLRLGVEQPPPDLRMEYTLWRVVIVVWVVVAGMIVIHGLHGYLSRAMANHEQSLIYLQDQSWEATRAEQRRINRWTTQVRLRTREKKGTT